MRRVPVRQFEQLRMVRRRRIPVVPVSLYARKPGAGGLDDEIVATYMFNVTGEVANVVMTIGSIDTEEPVPGVVTLSGVQGEIATVPINVVQGLNSIDAPVSVSQGDILIVTLSEAGGVKIRHIHTSFTYTMLDVESVVL